MFLLVISMVCFLCFASFLSTSQVEHHDGTIPWCNRATPPTAAAMDVIVPGRWADWTDWPDVTVGAGDADRVTPVGATKAMDAMVAKAKGNQWDHGQWEPKWLKWINFLWSSRSKWTCKYHQVTNISYLLPARVERKIRLLAAWKN